MQHIIISKSQENLLLEMIKKLFPKEEITIAPHDICGEFEVFIQNNTNCIHWFEFCIIHLIKSLADKLQIDEGYLVRDLYCNNDIHIVDFLHSKFLTV